MRTHPLAATAVTAVAAAASIGLAAPTTASATEFGVQCMSYSVPVTVAGTVGTHHVAAKLCSPAGTTPQALTVLAAGATYNSSYWDSPVLNHSYTRDAAAHGQATLAYDRFNTGDSDRLASDQVTMQVDADTVHQIITGLRTGTITGHGHGKVAVMGHSLGSGITIAETAQYHDTDALVLTGFAHTMHPDCQAAFASGQITEPAQDTPRPREQPTGDLTTPPGVRTRWFYAPGDDQAVQNWDEATKDVVTSGEMRTFFDVLNGPASAAVTVPTLIADGTQDRTFDAQGNAGALRTAEARYFTGTPAVDTWELATAGRDLAVTTDAGKLLPVHGEQPMPGAASLSRATAVKIRTVPG